MHERSDNIMKNMVNIQAKPVSAFGIFRCAEMTHDKKQWMYFDVSMWTTEIHTIWPNAAVAYAAFLHILEVTALTVGPETSYSECGWLGGFTLSHHTGAMIWWWPKIRPQLLFSHLSQFIIHFSSYDLTPYSQSHWQNHQEDHKYWLWSSHNTL
jgi:hypothetical protein